VLLSEAVRDVVSGQEVTMLLMIALGLFTTIFGVALGSAILELTVRALRHSLGERPVKGLLRQRTGSEWQTET
jgi:hypothetical protein